MHGENIGPRGCRRRRLSGWLWLGAGVVATGLLVLFGAPPPAMFSLALPFALAAFGFLQARARTCVALAAMGSRDRDAQEAGFEQAVARRRAAGVTALSLLAGAAVSFSLYLIAR